MKQICRIKFSNQSDLKLCTLKIHQDYFKTTTRLLQDYFKITIPNASSTLLQLVVMDIYIVPYIVMMDVLVLSGRYWTGSDRITTQHNTIVTTI